MEEGKAPIRSDRTGVLGFFDRSRAFIAEVRAEMKRVTWPTRKEVYATTFVVILTSSFFGLYLWGLDLAINAGVNWIFSAGTP